MSKDFGVTYRRSTAVVAGKFMPFHAGHRALLVHASKQAIFLHVLLVCKEDDTLDPATRALSIYEELSTEIPNVKVHIVDDIYTDDDTPESNIIWGRYTEAILGFKPDIVVASEEYGKGWAAAMGADFEMYDADRFMIPVSGTLCRANAFKQSQYLPPATKRYMLPRVVVMGAESTGTSTLANALGKHYDTRVVPELGRILAEEAIADGIGNDDSTWTNDRFWLTSRGQDAMEERMSRQANGLLICDTDSYATYAWYLYYIKKETPGFTHERSLDFYDAGMKQVKKHCLYIITSPEDVPFEDDGTRTGRDIRDWHHQEFLALGSHLNNPAFGKDKTPCIVVNGTPEQRLETAITAIDKVVGND